MKIFIVLIFTFSSFAQDITYTDQFIRLLPEGSPNTGGFITLENKTTKDIKLIGAKSDLSKKLELHTLIKSGEVMKMREVEFILLKAKEKTLLRPGGLHLMFMGLKRALKLNETIKVKLSFSNNSELEVTFPILDK